MNRPKDIPSSFATASWNPDQKRLTFTESRGVPSTITSTEITLVSGNLALSGIASQDASPTTYVLTKHFSIRASSEERARAKLAKQYARLQVTTSSDDLVVTQKSDRSLSRRTHGMLSRLQSVASAARAVIPRVEGTPQLTLSVQVPQEKVLYKVQTGHGSITAKNMQGDPESSFYTDAGRQVFSRYVGDLSATSRFGDISASQIIGDVHIFSETGGVVTSQTRGSLDLRTGHGNIQATEALLVGHSNTAITRTGGVNMSVLNNDLTIHAETPLGSFYPGNAVKVYRRSEGLTGGEYDAYIGTSMPESELFVRSGFGDVHVERKSR